MKSSTARNRERPPVHGTALPRTTAKQAGWQQRAYALLSTGLLLPHHMGVSHRLSLLYFFLAYQLVKLLVVQQLVKCIGNDFVLIVVLDVVQARIAVLVLGIAV